MHSQTQIAKIKPPRSLTQKARVRFVAAAEEGQDQRHFCSNPSRRLKSYLEITPHIGALLTFDNLRSCQLHIEWKIPKNFNGSSQAHGNSGIKFINEHEI